jgi:hypothetical protein
MPAMRVIRFPAKDSRIALMMGIPPATALDLSSREFTVNLQEEPAR